MGASPDVIVVGAGVAGTATAYFLSAAGSAVLLLDAERPGAGASGRNPGFLWLQSKAAGLPLDLSLAGRAFQETLGEAIGDFGFRTCGGLTFFRDEALRPTLELIVAERRQAGLPFELLDAKALHDLCPPLDARIRGAIWNPLDAHQDTRRLVAALAQAAERHGAVLRYPAQVVSLAVEAGRVVGVSLDDGEVVHAERTILAAGLGSASLLRALGLVLPLRPVRYEAAESAPAPFTLEPVVCGPGVLRHAVLPEKEAAVLDALLRRGEAQLPPDSFFTHQAAQYGDGRVQYGAFASDGVDEAVATDFGQRLGDEVWQGDLPDLASLPVERRWAGIVAQAPDYLPLIDLEPGIDGLVLNCGHAFGNLVGALSGRMVAAALCGESAPFPISPFSLGRFAAT